MDFRTLLFLTILLSSRMLWAAADGEFCIDNRLHNVAAATAKNVTIGISLEKGGRMVYPAEEDMPEHVRWAGKLCLPVKNDETLIIYERKFTSWKEKTRFTTTYLNGIDIQLGKAGRVDQVYGINLLYRQEVEKDIPLSHSWMTELYTGRDISLNQVCIPGTHNTGSYDLSAFSDEDPYMDKQLRDILQKLKVSLLTVPLKEFMVLWGKTQKKDTYQQLKHGARYLDIRVRMIDGELVTVHGLVGASIDNVLDDLQRFLKEQPGEVVIFHLSETHGMSLVDLQKLYRELENRFGDQLAPPNLKPTVTFAELQEHGYQVILVGQNTYQKPFMWNWSQNLRNTWYDKNRPYDLLRSLEKGLQYRNNNSFFVSQIILTPSDEDFKLMVVPGNPRSLEKLIKTLKFPSGFLHYLNNVAKKDGKNINIILQDFLGRSDAYRACMAENMNAL